METFQIDCENHDYNWNTGYCVVCGLNFRDDPNQGWSRQSPGELPVRKFYPRDMTMRQYSEIANTEREVSFIENDLGPREERTVTLRQALEICRRHHVLLTWSEEKGYDSRDEFALLTEFLLVTWRGVDICYLSEESGFDNTAPYITVRRVEPSEQERFYKKHGKDDVGRRI